MKWLNDFCFWIHRKRYAEGRYFKPVEVTISGDEIKHTGFEILKGPYRGTVYCYTKLTYNEDGTNFGWFITKGKGKNDPKFGRIARNILLVLLWQLINGQGNLQMGLKPGEEYESDRESNSEESYHERTVRKESPSLFED